MTLKKYLKIRKRLDFRLLVKAVQRRDLKKKFLVVRFFLKTTVFQLFSWWQHNYVAPWPLANQMILKSTYQALLFQLYYFQKKDFARLLV